MQNNSIVESVIITKKDVCGFFVRFLQNGQEVETLTIKHLGHINYQISGEDEEEEEEYIMINNCSEIYIKESGMWYIEENGTEYELYKWLQLDHKDGHLAFDSISI